MCAIRGGRRLRALQRGDAFIKDHGDVTNRQKCERPTERGGETENILTDERRCRLLLGPMTPQDYVCQCIESPSSRPLRWFPAENKHGKSEPRSAVWLVRRMRSIALQVSNSVSPTSWF